jgi:hypothetical protein
LGENEIGKINSVFVFLVLINFLEFF